MENIGQKKKQIQVGIKCHFQRDEKAELYPKAQQVNLSTEIGYLNCKRDMMK